MKSIAEPYRHGFLLKHSDFTCTVCILFMTLQPNALNSTYRQDTSHFDLVHKLPYGQTKLCKGPHRHRLNHVGSYCVHAALVTVFVWSHNQTPPQSKPRSGFLHSLRCLFFINFFLAFGRRLCGIESLGIRISQCHEDVRLFLSFFDQCLVKRGSFFECISKIKPSPDQTNTQALKHCLSLLELSERSCPSTCWPKISH